MRVGTVLNLLTIKQLGSFQPVTEKQSVKILKGMETFADLLA